MSSAVVTNNYAASGDVGVVRLALTVLGVDTWGKDGSG